MKKAKRLASLLLAIVMLLSLAVSVGAAGATEKIGKIEVTGITTQGTLTAKNNIVITNAAPGETYTLYQILYLDQYAAASGDTAAIYSYKATDLWKDFIAANPTYFQTDENGHVTWISTVTSKTPAMVEFAKSAMAYANATATKITPVATVEAKNTTGDTGVYDKYEITFKDLNLGYYLVGSSVGALCNLNTVGEELRIVDKNIVPTNEKSVKQGDAWQVEGTNNASIGDIIDFRSIITLHVGSTNVKFIDKMDTGLDLVYDKTKEWNNEGENSSPAAVCPTNQEDNLRLTYANNNNTSGGTLVEGTHYNLTEDSANNSFSIEFTDEFYNILKQTSGNAYIGQFWTITVYYKGRLTEEAVSATSDNTVGGNAGIKNTSKVQYGNKPSYTKDSTTVTKTWELPIFKYAQKGANEEALAGAQFKLYNTVETTPDETREEGRDGAMEFLRYVKLADGNATDPAVYRIATSKDLTDSTVTVVEYIETPASGKCTVKGLDSGTYGIKETNAPKGYNPLTNDLSVSINANGQLVNGVTPLDEHLIKILNNTGAVMPDTGGIGTTIFYIAGSILLIGAAVLLIVKKRMNNEK